MPVLRSRPTPENILDPGVINSQSLSIFTTRRRSTDGWIDLMRIRNVEDKELQPSSMIHRKRGGIVATVEVESERMLQFNIQRHKIPEINDDGAGT